MVAARVLTLAAAVAPVLLAADEFGVLDAPAPPTTFIFTSNPNASRMKSIAFAASSWWSAREMRGHPGGVRFMFRLLV